MFAVIIWIVLSAVVGWAGSQKGRSGGGFFLLSLILSPLIGILVVIAVPRVEQGPSPPKGHDFVLCHACNRPRRVDAVACPHCGAGRPNPYAGQKKCPACAEWILADAKKCKHCGEAQLEQAPAPPQTALGPPRWDKVNEIERDLAQYTAAAPRKSGSAFPWLILVLMGAVAIWALSSDRARAETVTVDGDTIRLNGVPVRLYGIDAAETRQWCGDYPAGAIATGMLASLIEGREVVCERKATDRYGRLVAVCRADGQDLGKAMVRLGAAVAFTRYSTMYLADEEAARSEGLGVHGRDCETPWQWRAAQRK